MTSYVYTITGSFPYIQIAKKWGLDLETVYCIADCTRQATRRNFQFSYWYGLAFDDMQKKLSNLEEIGFLKDIELAVISWDKKQKGIE